MLKPDHSKQPLSLKLERLVPASVEMLYKAWTSNFDSWFADPENCNMIPEVGRPYFFTTRKDWGSHPHYGRFLELEENRVAEMTWMTGDGTDVGTKGAETVLRLEFTPKEEGTWL